MVTGRAGASGTFGAGQNGEVSRSPIVDVPLSGDPIRVGQFLKLAGLAEHGAHAKELLEAGEVLVKRPGGDAARRAASDRRRGRGTGSAGASRRNVGGNVGGLIDTAAREPSGVAVRRPVSDSVRSVPPPTCL